MNITLAELICDCAGLRTERALLFVTYMQAEDFISGIYFLKLHKIFHPQWQKHLN
jgi:hypothetical protein